MLKTLCLTAALALVVGTNGFAATPRQPFEIHAILELTGSNAFLGNGELQTFQAIESLVNSTGGIRGRPLKFVIADDQTKPQISVQLANQLIADKAPVILGLALSSTCQAVTPLVTKTGPVVMCFTPSIEPAAGGYVFSLLPSPTDIMAVGIRYFRERHLTRLAVITSTDATGQYIDSYLPRVLSQPENKNMRLVAQEHFGISDISVSAQIARVKAANPQAIFLAASGTPFGTVVHGLHDAGLDVPIYASAANMTYEQMTQNAGYLPKDLTFAGTLGTIQGSVANGPVRRAQDIYFRALDAQGVRANAAHNHCWDAIYMIVDAFKRLGPEATAVQLHDYITHLRGWTGVNGPYDFRNGDQRGIGEKSLIVFRWDPASRDFVAASGPEGHPK
jgi:branched-chain amino acid transport system substrate-binding protein